MTEALPDGKHTFTAVATEGSGLGNKAGTSETRTFEVNTEPPKVTLAKVTSPTKDTTPSFSGTAGEPTEVVVRVYEGVKAEGTCATAKTTASGGSWSTTAEQLTSALPKGKHTFTAVATEASGLGNSEGPERERTFEVNTEPPVVALNQPASPSKETKPSFAGSASENTEVVVHVFEGSKAEGEEIASAKTTASGGNWSTSGSELSKALATGKHTYSAYATEASGLGNGLGRSAIVVFEVNTDPPVVTLNQPTTPSKETKPSFGGSASENTEVVVHVFAGSKAEGEEVATAKTTASGGAWATESLSKALATGKHTFSVYATEVSGLGNGLGRSATVVFEVNTEPPAVTLNPVARSNNTEPTFSGTASETVPAVTVEIYEGTKAEGTPVTSVTASGDRAGEAWTSEKAKLASGKHVYTAIAVEQSGLGNANGKSKPVTLEVDTLPPTVTFNPQPLRSNDATPSFSGTASEAGTVTVELEGETVTGKKVKENLPASVTAKEGGAWETKHVPPLEEGKYTAVASEISTELPGNGVGSSAKIEFEVVTGAPTVALNPVPRSNETQPSFSGTTNEPGPEVTVEIFAGTRPEGNIIATVAVKNSSKSWSTSPLSKPLPDGKNVFTAVAIQQSGLKGNKNGESEPRTFEVDTESPVVTLAQPKTPSNETQPSFSGTASEDTEVVVHVFEGAKAEGHEVASASATAAEGRWSTGALSKALLQGKHVYGAYATEKSELKGNKDGTSTLVTFEVDTLAPTVTLNAVPSPSNNPRPAFSGTASETTKVTVLIYGGSTTAGGVLDTVEAEGTGGEWGSSKANAPELADGEYTAVATQPSALGNPSGMSSPVTYTVQSRVRRSPRISGPRYAKLGHAVRVDRPERRHSHRLRLRIRHDAWLRQRPGRMRVRQRLDFMPTLRERHRDLRIPLGRQRGAGLRPPVRLERGQHLLLPRLGSRRSTGRLGDRDIHHPGRPDVRQPKAKPPKHRRKTHRQRRTRRSVKSRQRSPRTCRPRGARRRSGRSSRTTGSTRCSARRRPERR